MQDKDEYKGELKRKFIKFIIALILIIVVTNLLIPGGSFIPRFIASIIVFIIFGSVVLAVFKSHIEA